MKIVRIIGGLGNQMFQYALFLALKHKFPDETILIDASLMRSYKVHNGLEIDRVFGVDLPQASFFQLLKLTIPTYNYKLSRLINNILPKRKTEFGDPAGYFDIDEVLLTGDRYYDGYWLHFEYFEDCVEEIKNVYTFKSPLNDRNRRILDKIRLAVNSVSIHVRRGDFLKSPLYTGICDVNYYQSAINYLLKIKQQCEFFVFSDDIEWCKKYIAPLFGENCYYFIDWNNGNDSPIDMQLMAECQNNIIANSTFSWWAAFLNNTPNKIVCSPRKWLKSNVTRPVQMPSWILF